MSSMNLNRKRKSCASSIDEKALWCEGCKKKKKCQRPTVSGFPDAHDKNVLLTDMEDIPSQTVDMVQTSTAKFNCDKSVDRTF